MSPWYENAPTDDAEYSTPMSNFNGNSAAAVGTYQGVGPYGTYDMVGNAREWVANPVDGDLRLILGGFWMSPNYMSESPEALSPYDRSVGNGFRCVVNPEPLPNRLTASVQRVSRDFSKFKPASDDVFRAYGALYAYPKTPLNAKSEGIVHETADWREEKLLFDAAYNGERMSAYLFLPKKAKPPYQTILFFPSARVQLLPPNSNELGDIKFFDYILQSGRAVMYPVYQETSERRIKYFLPGASQEILLTTDWYKDAGRLLDYLDTRSDIDHGKMGYLGVSMGSADGVIITAMLREHGLDLCPHAEPDKEGSRESDVSDISRAQNNHAQSGCTIKENCNACGKDAVQEVSGDEPAQKRAGSDKRSSDGCTFCSDTFIRKNRGHMKDCPMHARAGEGEDADHYPEGGAVPDFMPGQTLLVLWRQW